MTAVVRPASLQTLRKHQKDSPLTHLGSCVLRTLLVSLSARAGLFRKHCSHPSTSILVKGDWAGIDEVPTVGKNKLLPC